MQTHKNRNFTVVNMDIIERLKEFMAHTGMSNSQFADFAGIPRPTLSQLIHGRNKTINDQLLRKLDDSFPDLDIRWLLSGKGDMLTSSNIEFSEPQNGLFGSKPASEYPDTQKEIKNTDSLEASIIEDANRKKQESYSVFSDLIEDFGNKNERSEKYQSAGDVHNEEKTSPAIMTDSVASSEPPLQKEIESIIVFYTDKSFSTFYPGR